MMAKRSGNIEFENCKMKEDLHSWSKYDLLSVTV